MSPNTDGCLLVLTLMVSSSLPKLDHCHQHDHHHRHQHDDDDHRHHPNFWHKLPYLHSDTLAIQNWETILNSRQNDKRNLLKRNFPPPCQRTTYNAICKKLSTQPSMLETILKMKHFLPPCPNT